MSTKALTFIIIAILIIIGIAYYASRTPEAMAPVTPVGEVGTTTLPAETGTTTMATSTGSTATTTTGKLKEFTVTGSNFKFAPSEMRVSKGDTVKITLKNTGGTHDLKIDEFNVATNRLSGGQEQTIEFVADKTGSFQYYCSIGTHRQMGMWGTLIVQ